MNIDSRVVTADPELKAELLEHGEDESVPMEQHARDRGLRPNSAKGQLDSVFLLTTPGGEEILMWEPGPGRHHSNTASDGAAEIDDDVSDPWASVTDR